MQISEDKQKEAPTATDTRSVRDKFMSSSSPSFNYDESIDEEEELDYYRDLTDNTSSRDAADMDSPRTVKPRDTDSPRTVKPRDTDSPRTVKPRGTSSKAKAMYNKNLQTPSGQYSSDVLKSVVNSFLEETVINKMGNSQGSVDQENYF